MWEYRVAWAAGKPAWWSETWQNALAVVKRQGREAEQRPDLYLALGNRCDVGLKLRGGEDGGFEAKVLHAREGGWELWEKVAFFRWNDFEATRFASLIRERRDAGAALQNGTPTEGVQAALTNLDIRFVEVRVEKTRFQASARELFGALPAQLDSDWLAELVEIRLPGRSEPLQSICVETMEPLRGGIEPFPSSGGTCCSYPELLSRHQRNVL